MKFNISTSSMPSITLSLIITFIFFLNNTDEGCSPEEFECRDETCIDRTKICNEMIDCPDGEDENHLNCAQKPKHNSEPSYFSWPWNKNNF